MVFFYECFGPYGRALQQIDFDRMSFLGAFRFIVMFNQESVHPFLKLRL